MPVDRLLLEYDDERAGGFAPLRFVPRGTVTVLGLVSSKTGQPEPADELRRQVPHFRGGSLEYRLDGAVGKVPRRSSTPSDSDYRLGR